MRRADLTAFRLFHGDAEGAPGLAVDRYGQVLVIHADHGSMVEEWLDDLRSTLIDTFQTAYLKVHPRSVARLSADERRRLAPDTPVWGRPVDRLTVVDSDVAYEIRPAAGLSVGLFLDMREVRRWLRDVCDGVSVLNLFAYTCSLGVCAALAGGRRVVNLDLSRSYLEWGKANYGLNGLEVDDQNFIYGDAFDWLARFARRKQQFDLVIVDPPSYSSTPFSVTRDYARLVSAAAHVVSARGLLLAATNHVATSEDRFERWLQYGMDLAGRTGDIVERWHEPDIDFPLSAANRPYLKVRAVRFD